MADDEALAALDEMLKGRKPRSQGRRKDGGSQWTPKNASALEGDGEYCKYCFKRHGYKSLHMDYYKEEDGSFTILWVCKTTGNVIAEQPKGEKSRRPRGSIVGDVSIGDEYKKAVE